MFVIYPVIETSIIEVSLWLAQVIWTILIILDRLVGTPTPYTSSLFLHHIKDVYKIAVDHYYYFTVCARNLYSFQIVHEIMGYIVKYLI